MESTCHTLSTEPAKADSPYRVPLSLPGLFLPVKRHFNSFRLDLNKFHYTLLSVYYQGQLGGSLISQGTLFHSQPWSSGGCCLKTGNPAMPGRCGISCQAQVQVPVLFLSYVPTGGRGHLGHMGLYKVSKEINPLPRGSWSPPLPNIQRYLRGGHLQIRLGWLAREPQGPTCVTSPGHGMTKEHGHSPLLYMSSWNRSQVLVFV